MARRDKTLPRIQNTLGFCMGSVFEFWEVFWILGSVFEFWEVFWIPGSVFDFRKCFVPMRHGITPYRLINILLIKLAFQSQLLLMTLFL